jgi:hypothetical protein
MTPSIATRPHEAAAGGRGSDYAQLSKQVRQAGLMQRRPGYYAVKMALTTGLFTAAWVGFALRGRSWYQLLIAPSWRSRSPRSRSWVTTPGTGKSSVTAGPTTCPGSCTATCS